MTTKHLTRVWTALLVMPLFGLLGGCGTVPVPPGRTSPPGFTNADSARGGLLYDKFWAVAGLDAPTSDHPLWASRPDTNSNSRTGADTWRCKECHGWDYKGVAGAYSSGSHRTGIAGIFGTTMTVQATFDLLKTDHAYGAAGLADADIWNLTKFVFDGQIDTDTIIDANGAFTGSATTGQTLYDGGIGSNLGCAVCHGADGLTINFKNPPAQEFLGGVAAGNPWEFQHKVRFGNPGSQMPATVNVNATNADVANVGAYSQTLPELP